MFDIQKPNRTGIILAVFIVALFLIFWLFGNAIIHTGWLMGLIVGLSVGLAVMWYAGSQVIRQLRSDLSQAECNAEFSVEALTFQLWLTKPLESINPKTANLAQLDKALSAYANNSKRLNAILAQFEIGTPFLNNLENRKDNTMTQAFQQWLKLMKLENTVLPELPENTESKND